MEDDRNIFLECVVGVVGCVFFALTLGIAQMIYPTIVHLGGWLDICAIIILTRFIAYCIRYISFKVFIMGITKPFRNNFSMYFGITLMLLSDFIAVNILSGHSCGFLVSSIWLKMVLAFIFTIIETSSVMALAFYYASTSEDIQY